MIVDGSASLDYLLGQVGFYRRNLIQGGPNPFGGQPCGAVPPSSLPRFGDYTLNRIDSGFAGDPIATIPGLARTPLWGRQVSGDYDRAGLT